jgi:hypothetical protein
MLVPQPPGQNRSVATKPVRKTPPQTAAQPLAAELPKPPVTESPAKPIAPLAKPIVPPPSIELPLAIPALILPEPEVTPPPAPSFSPEPDYTLASRVAATEYVGQPAAEMPAAPLPTMTPEPAMAPFTSAAAFNPAPATEFLSPLSIDLPPAAPVAMTSEPPLELLPPVTSFDHEPMLEAPTAQATFELPQVNQPEIGPEQAADSHSPATTFDSELVYTVPDESNLATLMSQPTADLSSSAAPTIAPEPATVPLLPPPETEAAPEYDDSPTYTSYGHDEDRYAPQPQPLAVDTYMDDAVTLRRSRGVEFLSWLRNLLPARPEHVPADAIEPSWAEQRTARGLAAALAGIAVLSLLPVALERHLDLRDAPLWALGTVLLAAVQMVYAGWLANAPDWATVRVQMILSAALTTIYAMLMTLVLLTPQTRTLILGLDEVRFAAPAWCGLMLVLMAAATWYCGRTSTQWRAQIEEERLNTY